MTTCRPFGLGGASFESADDETLNNWHERLNVSGAISRARTSRFGPILIRRRDEARCDARLRCNREAARGFADALRSAYRERLAERDADGE